VGRRRNRMLGTLRVTRLRAKQALLDAVATPTPERTGTPSPVPIRADDRRPGTRT